jgi:putative FmdB family regulatory protein
MPIYEYRCQACQHELEIIQKVSDAPMTCCPACGKESLTKLISRGSFQLKGTGWYATDYKDSGKKVEPKAEPKTETATDTKTEVKATEKKESKSEPTSKTPTTTTSSEAA